MIGSEQGGIRPVIVIQTNRGNIKNPTVIVAPLTKKINNKRKWARNSINRYIRCK